MEARAGVECTCREAGMKTSRGRNTRPVLGRQHGARPHTPTIPGLMMSCVQDVCFLMQYHGGKDMSGMHLSGRRKWKGAGAGILPVLGSQDRAIWTVVHAGAKGQKMREVLHFRNFRMQVGRAGGSGCEKGCAIFRSFPVPSFWEGERLIMEEGRKSWRR